MSFGGPGGSSVSVKPTPPERGSFPLDHDGECKHIISSYLQCLKGAKGVNDDECRKLAKGYLACRMDKNLMAPDEFKNLGLEFGGGKESGSSPGEDSNNSPPQGKDMDKSPPQNSNPQQGKDNG